MDMSDMKKSDYNLMLFSIRVRDAYPKMSYAERQIANYIEQNGAECMLDSANAIAQKTGTSGASVIRFCKTCGYSGLSELKMEVKRETDVNRWRYQNIPVKSSDSMADISRKVMSYHNMVINAMLSDWNKEAYSMAADAMMKASRILIIGEGGSQSTAISLSHAGLLIKLPIQLITDPFLGSLTLSELRQGDVLIGITYTGRAQTTIELFRQARTRGVTTIGIVGVTESPIMEYTDIPLSCGLLEWKTLTNIMSVRVAELAVVEILYSVVVALMGDASEKNAGDGLSVAEEIHRAKG